MSHLFEPYEDFIPDFKKFHKSLERPFPTYLRINQLRATPGQVIPQLREQGIRITRVCPRHNTLYEAKNLPSPGNLLAYFLGHIHPQAVTSALAALALSPSKGSMVLDMCAAPGGKSAHMADLMENTGFLVCNDLFANRHVSLGHTLSRLSVKNAVITGYQAQEFPLRRKFDYILADVPCSCEGRFRKTDKCSIYREDKGRDRLPELQKKILVRGFDLLKETGEMLYATCTYNPEENESVINFLLQERDAELLPINIGLPFEPGILKWRNETYDQRIKKTARFYPHRIDSVGFFMARIGRKH